MAYTTQADIAKRLNVTRITVSKALRDHPDISVEMKNKVHELAVKLDYTPNLIAKNLTVRKTFTIGVVTPDLENSFFAYVTDSIIDAASEKSYNVFVTVSRENEQHEKLNIHNLIGMRVDGILVCISQQTNNSEEFQLIKNKKIPLVFFDRKLEGIHCSSICFNDRGGALLALDMIIQEGYTKIAHFAGYSSVSIGRERLLGYRCALEKKRIKINPDWIIEGGFELNDGYNAFMKLYHQNNLPEILFVVNDRVALGAYHAAREVGLNIPEDIGMVAYGFNETVQNFTPPLAVINQDPRKLGRTAAETLIQEINRTGSDNSQNIEIEEEFFWNNSIKRK